MLIDLINITVKMHNIYTVPTNLSLSKKKQYKSTIPHPVNQSINGREQYKNSSCINQGGTGHLEN